MKLNFKDVLRRIDRIDDGIPLIYRSKNVRFGEHKSRKIGSGYDFEQIREVLPGEFIKRVAIRQTLANPGKIFVIEKTEPKIVPVLIIADMSSSILFKVKEKENKLFLLLELVGTIGMTCRYFHDPFGLIAFPETSDCFFTPRAPTEENIFLMLHSLFTCAQKRQKLLFKGFGEDFNLDKAADCIFVSGGSDCVIIFISDFMDYVSGNAALPIKKIMALASMYTVYFFMLDDPEELNWKGKMGSVLVRDLETGRTGLISVGRAKKIKREFDAQRILILEKLREIGVYSTILSYGEHIKDLTKLFVSSIEEF